MKKKTKIIIGILIAAVIAAAGITWYVMNQKNQKTGNSSAEVVAWDVDIEEKEPSEKKGILIPEYTCTLSVPGKSLAQETADHVTDAGSTSVKAYVIGNSENEQENHPEDEEHLQDESTTNAKTGDESKVGIWIAILLFSMIVLSCGVKHKKDNSRCGNP